jgi:hypothetical protein
MVTRAGEMQTATAPTAATLTGGVTTAGANQAALLASLQAIATGGFNIAINGTTVEVGPIDFVTAGSLTVCASRIDAAMADCICTWTTDHFVIATTRTGPEATLSFALAPSGPGVFQNISALCLLTSGTAQTLAQGGQGALNLQWIPCDGRHFRLRRPWPTPRPHVGMGRSTGTPWDYWLRAGRQAGALGYVPAADSLRIPYDPSRSYYVSVADDSSEADLTNPYTVQKPPPGVK